MAAQWQGETDAMRAYDEAPLAGEDSRALHFGEVPWLMEPGEPPLGSCVRTPWQSPDPHATLYGDGLCLPREQNGDFEAQYGVYAAEQYGSPAQHHMHSGVYVPAVGPEALAPPAKWCASYSSQTYLADGADLPFHAGDELHDYASSPFAPGGSQAWREAPGLQGPSYGGARRAGGAVARRAGGLQKTAPEPIWMRTPGSEGHERGVCRPCHYIRGKAGCSKGAACDHCHLAHRKATAPKLPPATRRRCLELVQRVFDAEHFDCRRGRAQARLDEFLSAHEREVPELRGYAHSVMKSLKGGAVLRSVSIKL